MGERCLEAWGKVTDTMKWKDAVWYRKKCTRGSSGWDRRHAKRINQEKCLKMPRLRLILYNIIKFYKIHHNEHKYLVAATAEFSQKSLFLVHTVVFMVRGVSRPTNSCIIALIGLTWICCRVYLYVSLLWPVMKWNSFLWSHEILKGRRFEVTQDISSS